MLEVNSLKLRTGKPVDPTPLILTREQNISGLEDKCNDEYFKSLTFNVKFDFRNSSRIKGRMKYVSNYRMLLNSNSGKLLFCSTFVSASKFKLKPKYPMYERFKV